MEIKFKATSDGEELILTNDDEDLDDDNLIVVKIGMHGSVINVKELYAAVSSFLILNKEEK